jgi:hypothetical protein
MELTIFEMNYSGKRQFFSNDEQRVLKCAQLWVAHNGDRVTLNVSHISENMDLRSTLKKV